MVEINLLPWRDYLSVFERKQLLRFILVALLAAIMAVAGTHMLFAQLLSDLQIKKTELDQVLSQHAPLQAGYVPAGGNVTGQVVALYAALAHLQPSSVCFTEITHKQNITSFAGRARSAADLTDYLLHWNAAALFTELQIEQLQRDSAYVVTFRFRGLSGEEGGGGEHQDGPL
jgi:Tfp pilus assembly protein PilN